MQVAIFGGGRAYVDDRKPGRGVCVPDDLPHEYILERAAPYLGRIHLDPFRLDAAEGRDGLLRTRPAGAFDPRDPWQFKNFLL